MLKKKKYAKWGNDDGGPDWGDLKHHDQEPEPEIQKVKEVRHQTSGGRELLFRRDAAMSSVGSCIDIDID